MLARRHLLNNLDKMLNLNKDARFKVYPVDSSENIIDQTFHTVNEMRRCSNLATFRLHCGLSGVSLVEIKPQNMSADDLNGWNAAFQRIPMQPLEVTCSGHKILLPTETLVLIDDEDEARVCLFLREFSLPFLVGEDAEIPGFKVIRGMHLAPAPMTCTLRGDAHYLQGHDLDAVPPLCSDEKTLGSIIEALRKFIDDRLPLDERKLAIHSNLVKIYNEINAKVSGKGRGNRKIDPSVLEYVASLRLEIWIIGVFPSQITICSTDDKQDVVIKSDLHFDYRTWCGLRYEPIKQKPFVGDVQRLTGASARRSLSVLDKNNRRAMCFHYKTLLGIKEVPPKRVPIEKEKKTKGKKDSNPESYDYDSGFDLDFEYPKPGTLSGLKVRH